MATNKPLTAQPSTTMPNKDVILAFQNMLVINIDEIRKLGSSNVVRVGLYSRGDKKLDSAFQKSYGLIDKNASPFCSDNALLEIQPPREGQLAFLAEEYGRSTGKKFTAGKAFDFKLLGNQILGQVKAWRALMGFRNIGSALMPKGTAVKTGYYLEFQLPEVQVASKKLQGIIQGLNTKLYDKTMMQQDFASAVPESLVTTCFTTPKTLNKKPFNPLSNDVLNLGKNLFDFESMVHVGYVSDRDYNAWTDSVDRFLASNKVEPTKHTGTEAPTFEETLRVFPQFKDVWAVSMHRLNLGGAETNLAPITALNGEEKAKQDAKNVQYALYSNNNATRLISTEEVENNTVTPFVKTFDLPNLYTNMSFKELGELKASVDKKQPLNATQKAKVQEALAYYRYINQCFIPVGNDVNVEVLLKSKGTEKAQGIATTLEKQVSNKTKGFEMDLGGSYAINLFEKNARIMSQGALRNDALNFVADDNSKFMDVRLPPAYRKEGESYVKLPLDYALAYNTNSNVVLLVKTSKDSKGINEFNKDEFASLWKQFNANTDFKALRYNFEDKNPPLNGVEVLGEVKYKGLNWADKVIIDRKKVTPSRLILDTFYRMMNSYLNLYGKFYSNSKYKNVDKLDGYSVGITEGLLDPEYPLFKTPFNMFTDKKFVNYTNVLRGVLFDPKTLFTTKDFKKSIKNIQKPLQDYKLIPGTKEFLAGLTAEYVQAQETKKATQKQKQKQAQQKQQAISKGISKATRSPGSSLGLLGATPKPKAQPKKASPNLCAKSFLVDSAFFSNVTDKKYPVPRFLPYTAQNMKFPKLDALNNPKTDGEFLRTLPSRTRTKQTDRITADSNTLHNIPALIPFIEDGLKYWGGVKKKAFIPCITPKVFDAFNDKKDILEAIVFYHAAATNCGSLLCAKDVGRMKDTVSVSTNPFILNPYTGDAIYDSPIAKSTLLTSAKFRMFESIVQLRKEYYALRLLALLGSYFSRAFDKDKFKGLPANQGENKGFIVYEDVFGDMVNFMLNDFANLEDETSKANLNYLLTNFKKKGDVGRSRLELGKYFSNFVFKETAPFTKIIQESFGKLQQYKYADARVEMISKCISKSEVDEAFKDKDLLAFIVDSQGYRPIDENEISEDAKELARRYYCSLSAEQKTQLKQDALKLSIGKTQATVAMLNPDVIELDEETKKMICSQVGRMRIMDVKSGDAFITKLKEIYHNSDKELQDALQKLACDKINVQKNIKAAEVEQEQKAQALVKQAEMSAQAEDAIAMSLTPGLAKPLSDFENKTGMTPTMVLASIAGLSVASYFGYKLFIQPKKA